MDRLSSCRNRDDLLRLLGHPKYAVSGEHFGTKEPGEELVRPDRVECYETSRCGFEVWFKDGRYLLTCGHLRFSILDLLAMKTAD
jgi:hypothetical protein